MSNWLALLVLLIPPAAAIRADPRVLQQRRLVRERAERRRHSPSGWWKPDHRSATKFPHPDLAQPIDMTYGDIPDLSACLGARDCALLGVGDERLLLGALPGSRRPARVLPPRLVCV